MEPRRCRPAILTALTLLVAAGFAVPAIASPAPVSACPPCGMGFVSGAANHDLDTEVGHGEATVRVHANGSATWTVHVVPTNASVLNRLAENHTLARAVATDSFGTRYGGGIDHELASAGVVDGAFVMRYRTLDVVREGPFGTRTLTYFRDSPGAWVYVDLGADELTVVAPPGTTVARGFGEVDGRRMTATDWPEARDGPFVVFAPEDSPAPGLLGALAVLDALGGVIVRNVAFFVALPGVILAGGLAGIRRVVDPTRNWSPTRLGGLVAVGGALLLVGTVGSEADALPFVTGNLLVGGFGGVVLLALGVAVLRPEVRRYLTARRIVGASVVTATVAVAVTDAVYGGSSFQRTLAVALAVLPAAVALGWLDAGVIPGDRVLANRLWLGISVAVVGVLVALAPLSALGGSLFLLAPILLTVASVGVVVVSIPLYLLGAAAANAESTASTGGPRPT